MAEIQVAHTADLDPATLAAGRALIADVFKDDDFEEADWIHALGGMHAVAWEGGELVGHASVIQRRLVYEGQVLRAGYVEGVGVHADHRRRGYADAMMDALERIIRGAYDLGALGATDLGANLYRARGWKLWEGSSAALTPDGVKRTTDDDGGIYVLPVTVELDLSKQLMCDWREGDVW